MGAWYCHGGIISSSVTQISSCVHISIWVLHYLWKQEVDKNHTFIISKRRWPWFFLMTVYHWISLGMENLYGVIPFIVSWTEVQDDGPRSHLPQLCAAKNPYYFCHNKHKRTLTAVFQVSFWASINIYSSQWEQVSSEMASTMPLPVNRLTTQSTAHTYLCVKNVVKRRAMKTYERVEI
jgi:hypothetical protein